MSVYFLSNASNNRSSTARRDKEERLSRRGAVISIREGRKANFCVVECVCVFVSCAGC